MPGAFLPKAPPPRSEAGLDPNRVEGPLWKMPSSLAWRRLERISAQGNSWHENSPSQVASHSLPSGEETRQIIRDPSSIAIGIVLPVLLILLFGYGLSLDVLDVPVAVVLEDPSPDAADLAAGFLLSPYFSARLMTAMPQAQELMLDLSVDGIVRIRPDFARHLALG